MGFEGRLLGVKEGKSLFKVACNNADGTGDGESLGKAGWEGGRLVVVGTRFVGRVVGGWVGV